MVLMLGAVTARASVDCYGDPLPPGAVARVGTVRWWCGYNYRPVVYTPDGKSLALCEEVGIVRFLDVTTGKELRRIEPPDNCDILFALAPDGKTGVTGSTDAGALLRLWDVSAGKELRQITNAKIY
ncbi:MAG: WD40 repeat domain-containing protein, partial [Terriglobales bacterium]